MAADTERNLTGRLPIENHYTPGVFGVTSRFGGGVIVVTYSGTSGAETVYLRNPGDSLTLDLINVDQLVVEAKLANLTTDSYPAPVLILQSTTISAVLTAAPYFSTVAGGNQPFHADVEVAAGAGGSTVITTPPAGYRAVVTSVYVTSDTATRFAVVDGADSAGLRLAVARQVGTVARFFGDPDGYVQAATATGLILVYAAAGDYFAAVDGYLRLG